MKLEKVLEILRKLAPEELAEPWDRIGLQLGDPSWTVHRALLCIDLTPAVLDEAIRLKSNLIVSYHPILFQPLERLTTEDWKQAILLKAARRQIAIYSPHTALDGASGGVNDWLCGAIGKGQVRPIEPRSSRLNHKVVVFVPEDHAQRVRNAMSVAGAGQIGNYVACSFQAAGYGTFLGRGDARPVIGQAGRLERVDELRLEMVCPQTALESVVAALRQTHPYEEPAFDIYQLAEAPSPQQYQTGQGRSLKLAQPLSVETLIRRVKTCLDVNQIQIAQPSPHRQINQVAVCVGAGESVLRRDRNADAYVTGEMRHHHVLAAAARGILVLLAGHTQTERPYLKIYRKRIRAAGADKVQWRLSRADRPPSEIC